MKEEYNRIFSLLAAQEGKLSSLDLTKVAEAKPEDTGRYLVEKGLMKEEDRATVDSLVREALKAHGGNAAATIQSLTSDMATVSSSLFGGADPNATRPTDPSIRLGLDTMGAAAMRPGATVPAVQEHEGRYTLLKEFGKGGMGKILLVHDEHLGRDIALKTLLPDRLPGATRTGAPTVEMLTVPIIARFLQEARVTGQLEHPSIVPVYELGYRADGSLYYTMKFVRGRTLQSVLEEKKTFQERLPLLNHFLNLCQAIAYAHSRHVVHRDIKPLNVMIGEFGETVVIDWGIAKIRGHQDIHENELRETVQTMRIGDAEATAKTVYGQTIGSPYFMPPEQAEGRTDEVNERSDVYSLGAVLYTILTGQTPYAGSTVREFLQKVASFPPKPVRDLEPNTPPELAAVCARAMAPKAEDRYPTAKELAAEIEKFLAGGLVSAYEYRFSELLKRFIKRHRTVLTTMAAAAVALLVLGVYSYVRVSQERDYAVEQEQIALEQKQEAEAARAKEEEARKTAETERTKAQRELYYANTALAQRSVEERQMAQARNLLSGCPESFRQWEWGHLQALCNADLMTLKAGGRFTAFAPGLGLITGSAGGTVALQNPDTGETVRTFVEKSGAGYAIAAAADGSRVAVSGEKAVVVWNTATGEEMFRFDEPKTPLRRNFLSLSANGAVVAAMNTDNTLRIWQIGQQEPVWSLPVKQLQGFNVYLNSTGDGALVARSEFGDAGWTRAFEFIRLPSGQSLGKDTLRDPLSVHAAAFSADGTRLALGTDDGLQLWTTAPWAKKHEFPARFGHPDTVAFSPDGAYVAAGTIDGTVMLCNVETGQETHITKAHKDTVRAVGFSHDGKRMATAGFDRVVRLWEAPGLRAEKTLRGHDKSVFTLAFNADDTRLATGGFDNRTKVWDLLADADTAPVEKAAFCPEHSLMAGVMGKTIGFWEMGFGHRIRTVECKEKKVIDLAFNQEGSLLAVVGHDQGDTDQLHLFNIEKNSELWSISLAAANHTLVFSPSYLAVHTGAQVSFRALDTGEEKWTLPEVSNIAFTPDGTRIAATGAVSADAALLNIPVILWNTASHEETGRFIIETGYKATVSMIPSIAFSPDGKWLAVGAQAKTADGSEGVAYVWDMTKNAAGPVWRGHKSQVACLAFAKDGARLATGGNDGSAMLWSLANDAQPLTLAGHASNLTSLAFSPDGQRLVTASLDGTFKIWDTENGREILTVQSSASGAEGQVVRPVYAAFSTDETHLFTLTDPPVPPLVLHAFPWNPETYPETPDTPLQDLVEKVKRDYWK